MKRGRIFRACGLAALLAAASAGSARAQDDKQPYPINVILPMTGNAAFVGEAHQSVLRLVEQLVNDDGGVNGRPLKLTFLDDQTSPQVANQLASGLLADKPAVLLGSSIVAMCNAEMALIKNGPFTYCFSPGIHPPDGSYMFSIGVSTHDLVKTLFHYFKLRGWTRVASITSTDATGQDIEAAFSEALKDPENQGVQLVERARFTVGDISVASQIAQIKAADPQVLVAWSTGGAIANVFKGVLQAGLNIPVATTNGNQANLVMTRFADFLPKELYVPTSVFPEHPATLKLDPRVEAKQAIFYKAMHKAGLPIDYMAAGVWDTTFMVVDALRKLGDKASAAQVRDYLASQNDLAGINGIYDFKDVPQRGLDTRNALVTQWDSATRSWKVVSAPSGVPLP